MAKITDLPDEVLVNIFKRKDALEVARLQHVCTHWWALISDTPTLWRNALFLEHSADQTTAARLHNRLCRVAVRSGGQLLSLGLFFDKEEPAANKDDASNFDIAMIQHIFAMLSELNVGKLFIYVRNFRNLKTIKELYKQICNLYCPSLEHLAVTFKDVASLELGFNAAKGVPVVESMQSISFSKCAWPLHFAAWKEGKIFAHLTALRIDDVQFCNQSDVWALYCALQHSSSLQQLYLDLKDTALPAKPCINLQQELHVIDVSLTSLTRFHLRYTTREGQSITKQLYQFLCPKLTTGLSLDCDSPHVLYKSLLTCSIESIRLTSATLQYAHNQEALSKCAGLRRVLVDCKGLKNADQLLGAINQLLSMPLDELLVYGPETADMQKLRDLVSSKVLASFASLKTRQVTFGYEDTKTSLNVLSKNRIQVRHVVCKKNLFLDVDDESSCDETSELSYEIDNFDICDDSHDPRLDM